MSVPWYDLNAVRPLPRIVKVNPRVLPEPWASICIRNKIQLDAVIGYENEAGNIKIWPAGNIIARKIESDEHIGEEWAIDSTSGNFGISSASVFEQLHERKPDFPIKGMISVVPRTLQPAKIARLRERPNMRIEFAENSADAMRLAEELASKCGYWYMRQYWNTDNSNIYKLIGAEIARQLPKLGIWSAGVGSGGTFAGTVPTIRAALKDHKVHCVAVAVEPGGSVGGVRTEIGLQLNGKPGGLPWRIYADDVNYVGLPVSLALSAALWRQSPDDPTKRIIAGESTGFALAGGLLSVLKLECMDKLDALRDEEENIHMAFPAPDTREPYREDYEAHGISLPD